MTQVDNIRELLESTSTGQHLLLGEFVLPFAPGEDDPTGVTSNVTDGRAQLWVDDDGNVQLSVFSKTQDGWTTVGQSVLETVTDLVDTRFALQEDTTDIKDVLVNAGLLDDLGATPLDLDGGDLTCNTITFAGNLDGSATSDVSARHVTVTGDLEHQGALVAFFGSAGFEQLTVGGSRGGNAALGSLLAALSLYGLIVDTTT